jgi:hypothetical protein
MRFYDHYSDVSDRRFRVRYMTYRPRSFGRLQSMIACASKVLRNRQRPLFLFTTLDRYLERNGALTRPCFLDHFGKPAACVRSPATARVGGLPAKARGMADLPEPPLRDRATSTAYPELSTLAAAAS